MVPLSRALQYHSATIKNLSLSDISGINTTAGWRTIIQLLRDPDSALETLDLNGNNITDEGVADIKNALVNNSRLKELNLNHNRRVTANEWINFSDVLLNPISSLEVLGLCNSCINDNVMFSFAVALSNNQRLRELNLHLFDDPYNEHVSSDGFAAFTRILCNNSSILSTYYSNHTLERLDNTIGFLPDDLDTLLILNNRTTKSQVARIKVILAHFSGSEINMQIFADMKLSVRPQAIAWMAQDNHLIFGVLRDFIQDNHLYTFLRTLPSLLERQRPSQKQRKRSSHFDSTN